MILLPWMAGYIDDTAALYAPALVACLTLLHHLLSNYELQFTNALHLPAHHWQDILSAFLLALSQWVFGFSGFAYVLQALLSLAEAGVSLSVKKDQGETPSAYMRGRLAH